MAASTYPQCFGRNLRFLIGLRLWAPILRVKIILQIKQTMKRNTLLLIFGQILMFIGFSTFIVNYFLLNNNRVLVFVIIIIFVISMIFNLKYLTDKIKELKQRIQFERNRIWDVEQIFRHPMAAQFYRQMAIEQRYINIG